VTAAWLDSRPAAGAVSLDARTIDRFSPSLRLMLRLESTILTHGTRMGDRGVTEAVLIAMASSWLLMSVLAPPFFIKKCFSQKSPRSSISIRESVL
jgi:hypothetical protein